MYSSQEQSSFNVKLTEFGKISLEILQLEFCKKQLAVSRQPYSTKEGPKNQYLKKVSSKQISNNKILSEIQIASSQRIQICLSPLMQ